MKILIAEDEKALQILIVEKLKDAGYSVDGCFDGEEAVSYVDVYEYDLIVLDVMMPKIDGLAVIEYIRKKKIKTPILLLTAKNDISDRVKGLDAGADDYLTKPFSFDELFARLRALLRRQENIVDNTLELADLTLNTVSKVVIRDGETIELTAKEYAILEYFLRNKNNILTRQQIAEHVWNAEYDNDSNVVDVYIRYLRRKIDDGFQQKLIHTVRGIGYVLKEEL
ncbi:response regulator transcription factor [Eubacteriaceae bacterium ES2]|nr:response regulator transcription factor [Eubacteriaceae bacterium ES2]